MLELHVQDHTHAAYLWLQHSIVILLQVYDHFSFCLDHMTDQEFLGWLLNDLSKHYLPIFNLHLIFTACSEVKVNAIFAIIQTFVEFIFACRMCI